MQSESLFCTSGTSNGASILGLGRVFWQRNSLIFMRIRHLLMEDTGENPEVVRIYIPCCYLNL